MSALVRVSALLAALVLLSGARSDAVHLTHADATARLKAAGITWWSSGDCSNRNRPECTSFEQIRATTVAGMITLKQASAYAVMVTGGTETGHGDGVYTHWNGWKVDIQRLDCITVPLAFRHTVVGAPTRWMTRWLADMAQCPRVCVSIARGGRRCMAANERRCRRCARSLRCVFRYVDTP